MSENWSREEVEAIVADYFAMWERELRGLENNKAEHNRQLQKIIPKRTRGSIEKKHQNISAVLWHLGYPYIDGYKPLPRYQNLLSEVVEERLMLENNINQLINKAVHTQVKAIPSIQKLKAVQVAPPRRKDVEILVQEEPRRKPKFTPRNYIEIETKNRSLGLSGEKFILEFECERLWKARKRKLANRVEHVAQTQGDYLGFDILSFETNGREKLIEVKTTRYAALTRFFASANEVSVSHARKDEYYLYRLYHFEKQPKFFVLAGSLHDTCQLKPANFLAMPL